MTNYKIFDLPLPKNEKLQGLNNALKRYLTKYPNK